MAISRSRYFLIPLMLCSLFAACFAEPTAPPRAVDDRLSFEVFADEQPRIVTPIGIAVDRGGRVFVVESHTHKRPKDYKGPEKDRIRVFEDTDNDGRADRVSTFYEGLVHTMDIAFHPDGSLYVSARDRILRLRDTDGDGKADQTHRIATLDTPATYPHNGLSSLAFDFNGNLWFGLGENRAQHYTLTGSDGTSIRGGGGIGRIFHCRSDGSNLRKVVRGLWNPFGLARDSFGRLFLTDNDPGDRPPCRLIHVVPGGDYGFERRYGSGLHPLNAWEGELPGTLPMISGTAEAPGGLIVYGADALPAEYRGRPITPSWADHRIEMFPLRRRGASFVSRRKTVVEGGPGFRPVDLAVAPDGSIYVSDWGSSSYPVHGKGRIWRLKRKEAGPGGDGSKEKKTPAPAEEDGEPEAAEHASARRLLCSANRTDRERAAKWLARTGNNADRAFLRERMREDDEPLTRAAAVQALSMVDDSKADFTALARSDGSIAVRRLAAEAALQQGTPPDKLMAGDPPPAVRAVLLRAMSYPHHRQALFAALASDDPFLRTAAVEGLADDAKVILDAVPPLPKKSEHRLGLLLALRRSGNPAARELLPRFLDDPDPRVRLAAVEWVADQKLTGLKPAIAKLLDSEDLTLRLYLAGYAALDRLAGREPKNQPPPAALLRTIFREDASPRIRRYALRLIDPGYKPLTVQRLRSLLDHPDPRLRLEAVRTLQHHPDDARFQPLAELAGDEHRSTRVRAEAIVGLAPAASRFTGELMKLTRDRSPDLRVEALRALVGAPLTTDQKNTLRRLADEHPPSAPVVARLLPDRAMQDRPAPEDLEAWLALLPDAHRGDPAAGRRIFFHPTLTACFTCHRVRGRGTRVGPDLSLIHQRGGRDTPATETPSDSAVSGSSDSLRRWLLRSILLPSANIAPQFVAWAIKTNDGKTKIGLPLRKGSSGEAYLGLDGRPFSIRRKNLASRHEMPASIMPPGLAYRLTPRELNDLLAFLAQTP